MDTGIILAVASFIGAILGAALTNYVTVRVANQQLKEARRKERLDQFANTLNVLLELRSELHALHQATFGDQGWQAREKAYGKSGAIMLAFPDQQVRDSGSLVLKTISSDLPKIDQNNEQQKKLDAINGAIIRVGELINYVMQE